MKPYLERRERAKNRLLSQLESGVKTEKGTGKTVPLTDSDKKRINKELVALGNPPNRYRKKNRKHHNSAK